MPVTLLQFILYKGVIVATVSSSSVNDYTLKFVNAILKWLECFRVKVSAHIKLKRELKLVIHFHSLERVVIEIKAVQVQSENGWESLKSVTFESICFRVAVVTEQLIGAIKLIKLKHLVKTGLHRQLILDLNDEIKKLLFTLP